MLFKDIIGHHRIKQQLISTVKDGRVSHAQLFYSKPGSTSFSLALAYAQYINCLNPSAEDSCGTCSNCKQFLSGNYPDLHYSFPVITNDKIKKPTSDDYRKEWLDYIKRCSGIPALHDWLSYLDAGNKQGIMTVSESSSLNRKSSLKSYTGGKKVFLIWLPELFHPSAANKLLKTIEEPEGDTLFLLISENLEKVLQTITSRCQKLFIPLYRPTEVATWLEQQGTDTNTAELTSLLAEGNLNEALRIAEDSARFHEYAVLFRDWMRACLRARVQEIFTFVDALSKQSRETIKEALSFYIQTIELSLKSHVTASPIEHPLFKKASFDLNKFAPFVHAQNAGPIHRQLSEAHRDIARNANPKIVLSDCSFKMSRYLHIKAS